MVTVTVKEKVERGHLTPGTVQIQIVQLEVDNLQIDLKKQKHNKTGPHVFHSGLQLAM